jgi:hypothetical protein
MQEGLSLRTCPLYVEAAVRSANLAKLVCLPLHPPPSPSPILRPAPTTTYHHQRLLIRPFTWSHSLLPHAPIAHVHCAEHAQLMRTAYAKSAGGRPMPGQASCVSQPSESKHCRRSRCVDSIDIRLEVAGLVPVLPDEAAHYDGSGSWRRRASGNRPGPGWRRCHVEQ